jgi:hypothetical protein
VIVVYSESTLASQRERRLHLTVSYSVVVIVEAGNPAVIVEVMTLVTGTVIVVTLPPTVDVTVA